MYPLKWFNLHISSKWLILICSCMMYIKGSSLVAQVVKNLPVIQETQVLSLGYEDHLEKEMTTHSSILAWENPWIEESGRLQSMGLQRFRHNWATNTLTLRVQIIDSELDKCLWYEHTPAATTHVKKQNPRSSPVFLPIHLHPHKLTAPPKSITFGKLCWCLNFI